MGGQITRRKDRTLAAGQVTGWGQTSNAAVRGRPRHVAYPSAPPGAGTDAAGLLHGE